MTWWIYYERFIQHVVTTSTSDDNDCEMKMNKVPFMTIHNTAGFFMMKKIKHFEQGLAAYVGPNILNDVQHSNHYIFYLDYSQLFPTFNE